MILLMPLLVFIAVLIGVVLAVTAAIAAIFLLYDAWEGFIEEGKFLIHRYKHKKRTRNW